MGYRRGVWTMGHKKGLVMIHRLGSGVIVHRVNGDGPQAKVNGKVLDDVLEARVWVMGYRRGSLRWAVGENLDDRP